MYAREGYVIESGQYQRCRTTGGRLPDWYENRPPLIRGDEFYMRAFWELSSCRQFGEAIGPIPWHRIAQYGSRKQLGSGMMGVFETVIRELDEAYLSQQREEQRVRRARK